MTRQPSRWSPRSSAIFAAALVDGRADRSTVDALEALLAARDGEMVARRKVVARR